jgi:hypothetical protein
VPVLIVGQVPTLVASNTTDNSASGYVVGIGPNVIGVWHVSPTASGTCAKPPCLITDGTIAITPWAPQSSYFTVPQPVGNPVNALDGRLTQAIQHSDPTANGLEAVWTQHTTGSASGRTVVTWYELIPAYCSAGVCPVTAKRQEGTLSSPALYLFNAAISPTSRGDAAVVHYNTGSATTFIDARAQRRDGADPLGTMSGELTLAESTVADNDFTCTPAYGGPPCRWGDYTGASPDPNDPCTVWGTTTISGSVAAGAGKPTWVTQNFALTEGMVQSAVSTAQYVLTGSDGKTWVDMDAAQLALGATRCASSTAVITANADLFTSIAGVNQDIGVFVSDNGAPDQLVAWKESGGFNGTFSPNAAYVQATFPIVVGHAYVVRVKWKTNVATAGAIYGGAGPLAGGGYSPTRLTIQYLAAAPQTQVTATQPKLTGNNGSAWSPIPGVGAVSLSPVANARVLFGGNADLWTDTAGINQDIGIMLNGTLIAWKESGGFAGTFSPNAAFVQATSNLTGGQAYTAQLVWKANVAAPAGASIFAGAGPLVGGAYSPTSLFAVVFGAGSNPLDVVITSQLSLFNSDGATWGSMNVQLAVASSVSRYAVVGANADLWTQAAGYNQDIAIFVSDNGSPAQLVVWKESGGFGGTYSPNAAFAEAVVFLTAGHNYVFGLFWKTNKPAFGSIFVGAGPISGAYSPARLLVNAI